MVIIKANIFPFYVSKNVFSLEDSVSLSMCFFQVPPGSENMKEQRHVKKLWLDNQASL